MMHAAHFPLFVVVVAITLVAACWPLKSQAQASGPESFMIEMQTEPQTIGDIKPAFLVYRNEELPKVSVEYVMKRYIKLFENAKSPDVKVDALNRINNLSAKYGLDNKKLAIDEVQQSEAVLNSYDKIVDSGVFYQRMDELLYQTAKALLFTGQAEESIKRLKMLIGLYPRSSLVDEARFRLAEAHFELRDFAAASAEYKKLLAFSTDDALHRNAKFKVAWSLFRENRYEEATKFGLETLDYYPALRNAPSVLVLSDETDQDLAADTLRLLAIVFGKQADVESLEIAQTAAGHRDYAFLLYDSLFRQYLKQDRFDEGAKIAIAYAREYGETYLAYQMALNAIKAYQTGRFEIREWQAKEEFVDRFGINSPFWAGLADAQRTQVRPHAVAFLSELSHLYYIRMQDALKAEDATLAAQHSLRAREYYIELTDTDPASPENGERIFLAAEAGMSVNAIAEAIPLYERSAYRENLHAQSATAGYAAIRAYDRLRQGGQWDDRLALARVDSIETFASTFISDQRTPDLLNILAQERFEEERWDDAYETAQRVLVYENAAPAVRYASALISAHSLFATARFYEAEEAYLAVLATAKERDRPALRERLAAAIYRQAELTANPTSSAELFLRMVDTVPESEYVPEALYAASTRLMESRDWARAVATLSHFRDAYPQHEYRRDVDEKLVFANEKNGDYIAAADQLLALADQYEDKGKAADALYQAAGYYEQEGLSGDAMNLYAQYIARYPERFELAIEAFDKQIAYYSAYYPEQAQATRRELVAYEAGRPAQQTPRSRSLGAKARYQLALIGVEEYADAALVLPLKKSLDRKKTLLKQLVADFEAVAAYGVAEYSAASTHQIGNLYRQLAKDLMASERPVELNALQLEQYDILLEEQAYPFEEQAIALYRVNTARAAKGQFDRHVKESFAVLAEMNPTEYLRTLKLPEASNAPY